MRKSAFKASARFGRVCHRGCAQSAFVVAVLLLAAFSAFTAFYAPRASAMNPPVLRGAEWALTLDDRVLSGNRAMKALGRDREQLSDLAAMMLPVAHAAPLSSPVSGGAVNELAPIASPLVPGQPIRLATLTPPPPALKPLSALAASASRARRLGVSRSPNRGFSGVVRADNGFLAPLKGFEISSRYGWRGHRFHNGVDLTAPVGAAILAVDAGRVVKATRESDYGNIVEVLHANGLKTRYAHLCAISVHQGQTVRRGQRLGGLGATGNATGPHLHFEVLVAGSAQNPERFLWR